MAKKKRVKTYELFIGGKRVRTDDTREVANPYDGDVIARVCQAGSDEMSDAVGAAAEAFPVLRDLPAYRKSAILEKIRDGIRDRFDEIVRTVALESGKPVQYARIEVRRAVSTFDLASKYVMTLEGEILTPDIVEYGENRVTLVRRFPRGPMAAITPYNWPINLVAHKVAPGIAVGNTIVLRPASQTPLSAHILAEIAQGAGLPDGALNVVPSHVSQAEQLIADERIKMITFTGSPEVGWGIREKAGTRQVSLELGGNAAAIVDADADLDFAVPRIAIGGFHYAGQNCISVQRIYVHRKIRKDFEKRLLEVVRKEIKAGDPMNEKVVVGPLINASEADRVMEWIGEAKKGGAKVLTGGKRRENVVEPTVLAGIHPKMKVSCREIFGPVMTLGSFRTFDEALDLANDPRYGIHAGVFTRDIQKAFQAFQALEVGGVIINDYPTFRVDNLPYGGVKHSGFGREGVKYAMEEMTELKHMTVRLESGEGGAG
jgi:glyceraldehyde-3-phosphate dehydrogenase (NADP+)